MNLRTVEVSVFDLVLDWNNPRFVEKPGPSQEAIRKQLFERENVISLARSIVRNHGFLPGERVVVCEEGNSYVVLEGNRRICACQCLLDPSLIPPSYRSLFPAADPETANNIRMISVDVVDSRTEALHVLASRHIRGPLRWSAVAKMRFFVTQFEAGKTVEQIAEETGVSVADVKDSIQEHNLLKYAFDLSCWDDKQRSRLNWSTIEPSAFLRLFKIRNAKRKLGLRYDSEFRVQPSCSKEVFDETIRLIALATLVEQPSDRRITTRAKLEDVPGLMEHLKKQQSRWSQPHVSATTLPLEWPSSEPESSSRIVQPAVTAHEEPTIAPGRPANLMSKTLPVKRAMSRFPRPYRFFQTLEFSLNPSHEEASALLKIAREIKGIPYERYPIAAAMLLRCLLEQSLKYHIKASDSRLWERLSKGCNRDPDLSALIKCCRNNVDRLFPTRLKRVVESAFNNQGTKEFLDLIVHQSHIVAATPGALESLAEGGLRAIIQHIIAPNNHAIVDGQDSSDGV